MKRIGCVGDNCVDSLPSDRRGSDFGGNPVNVAVYTRRLGGDISYVGAVGTDGRGAALLDALRRRGVDVSHVHVDEGSTAVTYVEHINGDRVFGNYDEGVMARFALTEEDIAFLGGHALVVSGLWGHAEGYLARIRQAGAVTAFDCSDRPEVTGQRRRRCPARTLPSSPTTAQTMKRCGSGCGSWRRWDRASWWPPGGAGAAWPMTGSGFTGKASCRAGWWTPWARATALSPGSSTAGWRVCDIPGCMAAGAQCSAVTLGYEGAW